MAQAFDLGAHASRYLAVGTLRLGELRDAIANAWEQHGTRESEILSGLTPLERALYDRFLKPGDRILLAGCGSGRDLIALLKLGYDVDGLDIAPRSVVVARQMLERQGLVANVYTAPIEAFALPGRYDVVVFSWCCYGYIPQSESRIGVLRTVKDHLNPGGRILIAYTPAGRPPRALRLGLMRFSAWMARSDWNPELGDDVWPGVDGIHYEHRFSAGEFEAEARAAGLAVTFHEMEEGVAVLTM
ncbi:MAG: class I SAM-dependent methyltransferase [Candidatus Rokubacteria bacterium]|nr:class I SAM-dependent methyltransferase [Candidatus Rokubacteria bacterium]